VKVEFVRDELPFRPLEIFYGLLHVIQLALHYAQIEIGLAGLKVQL